MITSTQAQLYTLQTAAQNNTAYLNGSYRKCIIENPNVQTIFIRFAYV